MSRPALEPTPEVARLAPYSVPAAGRRGFLRLDFNESAAGPSPRVLERLRALDAEDVALYPDETEARAALRRHFALGDALDCVLTSGVDEAIRLACDCFVRPGERALVLEPGYAMYRFYATLAGAEVTTAAYAADLSFPPPDDLARAAEGCRIAFFGAPNNPTGTPLPAGVAEERARRQPQTLVFVDEAYAEFDGSPSHIAASAALPNLLVARTFSKAYGLAGLRAGVLIGAPETLAWIARMRSPYPVNTLALAAIVAALGDRDHVDRYVAEVTAGRAELVRGLAALGVECFPSAASFVIARFGPSAPAVRAALRDRRILVRDRSEHPILRGTLRIGVGTRADVARCLEAIAAVLPAVTGAET